MVRTGILSMQRIANYGSFLQAYGLKKILEELGAQAEFVDYHVGECLVKSDGNGITRKFSKVQDVFKCYAPFRDKVNFIGYKKNFAHKYYPLLGIGEGRNYAPELDLLVVGSDEVFNCVQSNANVGYSPELFGAGNRAKRLISYAASFGNTTLDRLRECGVADEVAGWLSGFDSLSVRDENSGMIVSALTKREPEYHLDPVLVYDFMAKEKAKIPKTLEEEDYLLLYGYTGRFAKEECGCIRTYADNRGLKILCIGGIQHCCDRFVDCSPFELFAYFKNAAAVVTDTFHGTVLSVITHQKFVTIVREQGNSEKLADLLRRLNLEDRQLTDLKELGKKLDSAFDYAQTDGVIEAGRQCAYGYLRKEIKLFERTLPYLEYKEYK